MAVLAGTVLDNGGAVFNVKNPDFAGGAIGDGVADDGPALQAAIAAATAVGGVVFVPPGNYKILSALYGVPGARNVLLGANRDSTRIFRGNGPGETPGAVLDWQTVGFAHRVSEFGSRIEELTLDSNNDQANLQPVVVDIADVTFLSMRRVTIAGHGVSSSSLSPNCIGLRLISVWDSVFEDIYVTTCGGPGGYSPCVSLDTQLPTVNPNDSLNNCHFYALHIEPGQSHGIHLALYGNSGNEVGDNFFVGLKTHGHPTEPFPVNALVTISQHSRANVFFGHILAWGHDPDQAMVELDGERNTWYSPTIGIDQLSPPLAAFRFGPNANSNAIWSPNIKNSSGYASAFPFVGDAVSKHNKLVFPSISSSNASPLRTYPGRNVAWWDDINTNAGLILFGADGLLPTVVNGISGSTQAARNLRGTVDVSGSATFASLVFPVLQPEADDNYRLVLTPVSLVGSPAAGSSRVRNVSKATSGFTVYVEAAPGTNSSVTFDWILVR